MSLNKTIGGSRCNIEVIWRHVSHRDCCYQVLYPVCTLVDVVHGRGVANLAVQDDLGSLCHQRTLAVVLTRTLCS